MPSRTGCCQTLAFVVAMSLFTPHAHADVLDRMAESGTMVGDFNGVFAPVLLPTEYVAGQLPQQLQLGDPQAKSTLVLLVIGQQRDVHFVSPKKFVRFRPEETKFYHEVIIAVPNVFLEGEERIGPCCHFSRLYLDSQRAIDLGKRFWGYPKQLAKMNSDETSYRMTGDKTDAPLLSAKFKIDAPTDSLRKTEAYAKLQELLDQPIILKHQDTWVFKRFDWNLPESTLSPAYVKIEIGSNFWGDIEATIGQPALGAKLGAFHLRSHWSSRQIDRPLALEKK